MATYHGSLIVSGLLSCWGVSAVSHATSLNELFQAAEPPVNREQAVDIFGWIERNGPQSLVRVSLNASQGVKLVADPGIVITPIADRAGVWVATNEVVYFVEGQNYFDEMPTVDVGLITEDGLPVKLDVSFAYCLVDDICLFGEDEIIIETKALN